jgi:hypothetical protein
MANLKAQSARMTVIGAEIRLPNVLKSRKAKTNHTPMLTKLDNLPAFI